MVEVAIFHATGMGMFEAIAGEGGFAAVMDFALSEVGKLAGSLSTAASRLTSAGAQLCRDQRPAYRSDLLAGVGRYRQLHRQAVPCA